VAAVVVVTVVLPNVVLVAAVVADTAKKLCL
jgi:hypothetical protein